VAALPLFDEDLEVEPLPEAVQRFQAAIRDTDAIRARGMSLGVRR